MPSVYSTLASWSWLVLSAVWLPGYFMTKRDAKRPLPLRQFVATSLIAVSLVLLLSYGRTWLAGLRVPVTPQDLAFGVGGLLLDVVSIAFAIWARLALGRNWSGIVAIKKGQELVETGPYRFVRHPIYTGMLFAQLGTALTVGTLLAYAAV